MRGPLLASLLDRNNNNFNLVRLLAAASVIVSHGWLATGGEHAIEPLYGPTPFTLGQHAVLVFFSLSGFLVAASLHRARTIGEFLWARILRIYPALLVCLFVVTFLVGPAVTTRELSAYFADSGTYAYLVKSAVVLAGTYHLPGVFETTPYAGVVDLPIWTLKYEILCYLALAGLGALGLFRKVAVVWAVFALATIAYLLILVMPELEVLPKTAYHPARPVAIFFLGVPGWHSRHEIRLSAVTLGLVVGVAVALHGYAVSELAWVAVDAYGALCLAALPLGAVRRVTNRFDISYGLYIYGWTIEQILVDAMPHAGALTVGLAGLVIASAVAWASWNVVERPALRLKRAAPVGPAMLPVR